MSPQFTQLLTAFLWSRLVMHSLVAIIPMYSRHLHNLTWSAHQHFGGRNKNAICHSPDYLTPPWRKNCLGTRLCTSVATFHLKIMPKTMYQCTVPHSFYNLNCWLFLHDQIRGMRISEALAQMEFCQKKPARFVQMVCLTSTPHINEYGQLVSPGLGMRPVQHAVHQTSGL